MKDSAFYHNLTSQIDKLTLNYNQKLINIKSLMESSPLNKAGLSLIEQMVLRYMYFYQSPNMSELGYLSNLKPAYLSRITENLVKSGYAQKHKCKDDQRVYYISLTKTGYELTKAHVESHREYVLKAFSNHLSGSELSRLREDLLLVIELMESLLEKNGIWRDIKPAYALDLYQLMDRRTKNANRFFLHFSAEKKLPYYNESFNHYQNNIFIHLYEAGEISISALSKTSGLKLKHLSGALKGLIKRGFIEKYQKATDKRVRYIKLSHQGRILAQEQESLSNKYYQEYFNNALTDAELETFLQLHQSINKYFERF